MAAWLVSGLTTRAVTMARSSQSFPPHALCKLPFPSPNPTSLSSHQTTQHHRSREHRRRQSRDRRDVLLRRLLQRLPAPRLPIVAALSYLNALNITSNTSSTDPNPLAGHFNTTSRAFPDVAMQGRDIEIVAAGQSVPVFGTSASSPMFVSMVALINDQLLSAGRPTLGFLNPLLYSRAAAAGVFNDITVGSNVGMRDRGIPGDAGLGCGTSSSSLLREVLARMSGSLRFVV